MKFSKKNNKPKYDKSQLYDECRNIVSAGNYIRIDCTASVPGQIANNLGKNFKYAVVLGSNLESIPEYFSCILGSMPDGPFYLIRITRDDSSHGIRHENADEKIVWKTKVGHRYYIRKLAY